MECRGGRGYAGGVSAQAGAALWHRRVSPWPQPRQGQTQGHRRRHRHADEGHHPAPSAVGGELVGALVGAVRSGNGKLAVVDCKFIVLERLAEGMSPILPFAGFRSVPPASQEKP